MKQHKVGNAEVSDTTGGATSAEAGSKKIRITNAMRIFYLVTSLFTLYPTQEHLHQEWLHLILLNG